MPRAPSAMGLSFKPKQVQLPSLGGQTGGWPGHYHTCPGLSKMVRGKAGLVGSARHGEARAEVTCTSKQGALSSARPPGIRALARHSLLHLQEPGLGDDTVSCRKTLVHLLVPPVGLSQAQQGWPHREGSGRGLMTNDTWDMSWVCETVRGTRISPQHRPAVGPPCACFMCKEENINSTTSQGPYGVTGVGKRKLSPLHVGLRKCYCHHQSQACIGQPG